jgi:DNA-binding transcriptional MerR regulator
LFAFLFAKERYKERRDIMEQNYEKAYTTKEVSTTLDIGDSTLRKWCLALEKNGYKFIRNDQNKRLYTDRDLVALRHFQVLVQQNNFPLDNAALVVSAKYTGEPTESGTGIVLQNSEKGNRSPMRSDNEAMEKLMEHIQVQQEYIERQEQFNKELLDRLDKQQKYIDERLNERDKALTSSIRELQKSNEEIKQLNAAEPERKSIFSRLWGK